MASTLKLSFSIQFSSPIWQMIIEPGNSCLFIETRDGDNLNVSFSAYDISSQQFLWRDWALDEKWMVGLLAANKEVLLLQRFMDKGNPDKKSLMAFEITTRKALWEVTNFSFNRWNDQFIYGKRTSGNFSKCRIEITKGLTEEFDWHEIEEQKTDEILNPVQFLHDTPYFDTVKKFILSELKEDIKIGVEYLEYNGFIISSAYLVESQGLANYLIVFNERGELALKERIAEKIQGLGMGTFFVLSGCLFFVKNRLELVAYKFL